MDQFVISEFVKSETQIVDGENVSEYAEEFLWPNPSDDFNGEYPTDEVALEPSNSDEEMNMGDDQDLLTPSHEMQAADYFNQDPEPKTIAPREKRQRIKTGLIYECDICEKKFQYESSLQIHKRFHSGEKLSQCNECGKRFATQYALKRHSRTHEESQAKVCEICNASFTDSGDFAKHQRFHETGEPAYTCKECGETFETYSSIKAHRSRKHRAQWQCKHCWESFPTEKLYREHRVIHETYACSQCNMKFMTQEMLEMHEEEAGEHRPPPSIFQSPSNVTKDASVLECDLCSKRFTRRDCLLEHRRLHTGVGLVSCEQCPMKFTSHARLRKHMVKHDLQRSFQCPQCEKCFATERYLKIHSLTHGEEQLPFPCEICGKEFLRSYALRNHMFSHMKKFPCTKCSLIFPSDRQLKKHRKTHKLNCNICGMSFETLELLNMHYLEYHPDCPESTEGVPVEENPNDYDPLEGEKSEVGKKYENLLLYRCEICNKTFTKNRYLRDHLYSHMKRYPCNRCNEVFSSERLLKKHRKTHKLICRECDLRCESVEDFQEHYRDYHPGYEIPEVQETVEKNTPVEETSVVMASSDDPLEAEAEAVAVAQQEPKNFRCETCGKEFSRLSYLKTHENTHTKSFPCTRCFMVLPSERQLKKHRISHRLVCTVCNTRFDTGELLHEHYKEQHPKRKLPQIPKIPEPHEATEGNSVSMEAVKEKPQQKTQCFPCQYCSEKFYKSYLLETHLQTHLANKFPCKLCPEIFDNERLLRKHIKAHRRICRFCTRKFKTPERLQAHYQELHSHELHLLQDDSNSQKIKSEPKELQKSEPIEEVFTEEPQIEERYPIEEIFTVEDSIDGVFPEVVILEDD